MKLDKLVNCIETLKSRIENHRNSLQASEMRTRVALIDPLLRTLGWDVADPSMVEYEAFVDEKKQFKDRADYVLISSNNGQNNEKVAILEAKKLDTLLEDDQIYWQIERYAGLAGTRYSGITDGNVWRLYSRSSIKIRDHEKILDVTINSTPNVETALKLLVLWHPNLETGDPVEAGKPILIKPQSELATPPASIPKAIPPDPSNWVPISNFKANPKSAPPQFIRTWDGSELPIKYWNEILVCVVKKLYDTKRLTDRDIPILFGPNSKRYIVHTEPIHVNGSKFHSPKKIAGTPLVVEALGSGNGVVDSSKKLLKRYEIDPSMVQLKVE